MGKKERNTSFDELVKEAVAMGTEELVYDPKLLKDEDLEPVEFIDIEVKGHDLGDYYQIEE